MVRECEECGCTRADGWILIKGKCVACAPENAAERRAELRAQAIELMREKTE